MILLFSKVDPKRPYYKRDLLNACCARTGARLQLAYQIERWVSEPLRQADRLTGRDAMIVFCEQPPERPYTDMRFHPLRFGRIERTWSEHGYLTLELSLTQFFDVRKYASQPEFYSDFKNWILRSRSHPALAREQARFVCEYDETYSLSRSDDWQPLAEHAGRLEGLSDSAFLRCDISQRRPRSSRLEPRYLNGHTQYEVRAGSELEVSSLIHFGQRAVHQEPDLSFSNSIASVTGPFVSQRSCGLQAVFSVRLKRSLEPEDGQLALRIPSGTPESVISSETAAMVRISTSRLALWSIALAVSLGALMAAATVDQVKALGPLGWRWFEQHLGIVTALIKAVGVFCIFLGARQGFSKLPLKE